MKTLIIYSSRSGNTKKLAEAVFVSLNEEDTEKTMVSITDLPVENYDYDLVIAGFSIMAGRVEPRMARFLASFTQKTKLLLFMTHGSARGSEMAKTVMNLAVNLVKTAEIVGCFSCQGEVAPNVLYKLGKSANPPAWLGEGENAKGHPDDKDCKELIMLVQKTLRRID